MAREISLVSTPSRLEVVMTKASPSVGDSVATQSCERALDSTGKDRVNMAQQRWTRLPQNHQPLLSLVFTDGGNESVGTGCPGTPVVRSPPLCHSSISTDDSNVTECGKATTDY